MKRFQFFVLLAIGLMISACGKDKGDCLRDDFIGDYIGFSSCDRLQPVDATVKVIAGPAADELLIDLEGTMLTVTVDGCTFSGEEKAQDVDITYNGSLDANKITVELKGTILGIELDCKSEAVK